MTLLIIATIASCVLNSEALSLSQVRVPPFGLGGDKADLGCEYDTQVLLVRMESIFESRIFLFQIQGDQVYSVKWYKGGLEIFRFIPSNNPAIAVFER